MRTTRRIVLAGALGAPMLAAAQAPWPTRPVRILISFPPGGSSDFVARALAPHLTEAFGQPFLVDNRPGAGGMLAAEALKREAPDGHTFLLSNNAPFTIAPTMFPRISYDVVRDFTHVAYLGATFGGLTAHHSAGLRNVADLVARARAQPGRLNFGSSGTGSIGHITGNTFARMAGIDIVHVPYRGAGPLRTDLQSGIVELAFEGIVTSLPQIRAGVLAGLAVAAPERLSLAPDIGSFREQGYDLVLRNWHGLSAPAGLPAAIIERLVPKLDEICRRPAVNETFLTIGNFYESWTTARFQNFVAEEIAAWRPRIIEAGAVER
jgi:tripartite-type tricarboxylate transporter receptor subunit TctC